MKKIFRKAITVLGSVALIGATVSTAAAAAFPAPFTSNAAIVTGANAAASDSTAATNIASAIDAASAGTVGGKTLEGGDVVTDDEVPLGGTIAGNDLDATMDEDDFPSLIDGTLSWDDGSGTEQYDIKETISFGTMNVLTTLDDKKLDGVALSNENGLTYNFTFVEGINTSLVGDDDADDLYLTLLGKEYEITSMSKDSITVVTSEEVSLAIGESVTVDGKTFTLDDVWDDGAQINGEIVDEGESKKVSGFRVEVTNTIYHDNSPELGKAIVKIGEDISKTFTSGDEYIGQDEDDPLWVWDIDNLNASAGGYIAVKYNADIDSANDKVAGDSIKYAGEGYMMPTDFAQVTLDGLTEVDYQKITISFEDDVNLFNNTDSSAAMIEDRDVLVIEAENDDAFTINGKETGKIYVYYNGTLNTTQLFYDDAKEKDYTPVGYMRYTTTIAADTAINNIATFEYGDTNLDIDFQLVSITGSTSGTMGYLTITNDEMSDAVVLNVSVGGELVNNTGTQGSMEYFGATEDTAEAGDVRFNGTDVSVEDYDYMDKYGIILSEDTGVETEADDDMVTLSIPDEQVYAKITVTVGGSAVDEDEDSGIMTYKDTESSAFATKNLVVVGGSAINSVAAELLGDAYSEAAFTAETGVAAGQFMIESFDRSGKTALLVAGYNAEDTVKAANYLTANAADVDTTVGNKYVGSTETSAELIVA